MAIFDSTKKTYLTFNVVLTDAAQVKALQAQYPSNAPWVIGQPRPLNVAPLSAAATYAAPWVGYDSLGQAAPFSYSTWAIDPPGAEKPYPVDVATFERHTGGFWGIGGTTVRYYWIADFVLASDGADGNDPAYPIADLPARKWIEGFETPKAGTGSLPATAGLMHSRDAARHVGGQGLAFRGAVNANWQIQCSEFGAAASPRSWERFYVRLRRAPTETRMFWRWSGSGVSGIGVALGVTASGQIAVYKWTSAAAFGTLIAILDEAANLEVWDGTTGHNAWRRIDVLIDTKPTASATASVTRVFVDGVARGTFSAGAAAAHGSSLIGTLNSEAAGSDLHLDVDDWHCAGMPGDPGPAFVFGGVIAGDVFSYNTDPPGGVILVNGSMDWKHGTKIQLVKPAAFASDHDGVAWEGDVRVLMENPALGGIGHWAIAALATPSARASVTTDSTIVVDRDPHQTGVTAVFVCGAAVRHSSGLLDAQLGYTLGAAAEVLTPVTVSTALTNQNVLVSNTTTAGINPVDVTPIKLAYLKDSSVNLGSLYALLAQVQMVGTWGPEDYTPAEREDLDAAPAGGTGTHNAPYPLSPWAQVGGAPPSSPYIVHAGTFVGNGTGQDLTFRAPVHWFWLRPLTGSTGGGLWLSPMLASHRARAEGVYPSLHAEVDPTFAAGVGADAQQQRYRIRIGGGDNQFNAIGVTYQYVAVADPGMVYMLNAGISLKSTVTPHTSKLIAPGFLPGWAFIQADSINSTATARFYAKGPGHDGTESMVNFAPAVIADALNMSVAGELTTKAALATGSDGQMVFSLWRKPTYLVDAGETAVVNFGTYTGDASASRTVSLAPASGRRPVFVMVFAASGSSYTRDPSHTGSNSSLHGGTETATGITGGGVDFFSVGSSLNANGVVYNYFVLYAIADCEGNNGWGCNGENIPREPTPPGPGGPWPPEPTEPGTPEPGGPGTEPPFPTPVPWPTPNPGGPPTLPPDFSIECAPWSTYIINAALSRAGVAKQIPDILTENSEEGWKARLLYALDVEQALRDFPWPFATKFAALTLVGGSAATPVNADWQYAYRRPHDCVFERRIVVSRGAAVDPTPPPFALGRDALGAVIFTNVAAAHLEYTMRVACAATDGDNLFREALIWRHAASLAGPLARNPEIVVKALEAYTAAIAHAEDVIRPGAPGRRTIGVADPYAVLKARVVNRALLRIGCRTIADYESEQSREATAARAIFEDEYTAALREFRWGFATRYADLVVAAGTASTPVNLDWQYAYTLPADYLAARRLVRQGSGRRWDPEPFAYRVGSDAAGVPVLYTDELTPHLEYTAQVPLASADPAFLNALAWRLASSLAPSVAPVDLGVPEQIGRGPDVNARTAPEWRRSKAEANAVRLRQLIADRAWAMYVQAAEMATTVSANEEQQTRGGDPDWITGRT